MTTTNEDLARIVDLDRSIRDNNPRAPWFPEGAPAQLRKALKALEPEIPAIAKELLASRKALGAIREWVEHSPDAFLEARALAKILDEMEAD